MLLETLGRVPTLLDTTEVLLKYSLWNVLKQIPGNIRRIHVIDVRHEKRLPFRPIWVKNVEAGVRMCIEYPHSQLTWSRGSRRSTLPFPLQFNDTRQSFLALRSQLIKTLIEISCEVIEMTAVWIKDQVVDVHSLRERL